MMRTLFAAALFTVTASAFADPVTVTPTNHGRALVNPGMGWCFYQYSGRLWAYGSDTPRGDTLDWFPGASVIYFRVPWGVLEPQEGVFRWDVVDSYAQPWIARGKKVAFRITCCESRFRYATPEWVRQAGCKGIDFQMPPVLGVTPGDDNWLWEPNYDDPVFNAKLDHFLAALARRYDGNPSLAFMDIGTIGMWGEGHTLFSRLRAKLPLLRDDERDAIVSNQFRMWRRHFKKSVLLCVDDMAGDRNMAPDWPTLKLARELGIGFRDDSILVGAPGGNPPRAWWHHGWAQLFSPTLPVAIEHEHHSLAAARHTWSPEALYDAVVDYRASWVSIHDWPKKHYEANKAVIDKINRRLGYRLELRRVTYPKTVRIGGTFEVASEWVNVGVAPCLPGGVVAWSLIDDKGLLSWTSCNDRADLRAARPTLDDGEHPLSVANRVTFGDSSEIPRFNDGVLIQTEKSGMKFGKRVPTIGPGVYTLAVSVGREDGTPTIALPLEGGREDRRYPIGRIELLAP